MERQLGLARRLAECVPDQRDPLRITHPLEEMLRLRMFAIAAGYEDADDCDALRHDPVFKMAVRHAPESGDPLCSRPTMSRLENAPGKIELAQMQGALVLGSSGVGSPIPSLGRFSDLLRQKRLSRLGKWQGGGRLSVLS